MCQYRKMGKCAQESKIMTLPKILVLILIMFSNEVIELTKILVICVYNKNYLLMLSNDVFYVQIIMIKMWSPVTVLLSSEV